MRTLQRLIGTGALALSVFGWAAVDATFTPRPETLACDMNLVPYDPYHQTCGIPNQVPTGPGQAPGAGAIIACRGIPGCLSQAVNGPQLVKVPQVDTRVRQSQ